MKMAFPTTTTRTTNALIPHEFIVYKNHRRGTMPIKKADVVDGQWRLLLIARLFRRLDWIYTIDLVEAPFSVCEPSWLRLSQLVEAKESGDVRTAKRLT